MSFKKQLLIFIIALVVFATSLLPVSFISKYVELPNNVAFKSLQGTVWSGRIAALQVNDLVLRNITWSWNAGSLLTGKLGFDFKVGNARDISEISGKGNIQLGLDSITLNDLTLRAPADTFRPMIPIPMGKLGGRAIVELDEFKSSRSAFVQGSSLPLCEILAGEMMWTKSEIQIGQPVSLGVFAANLDCQNGEVLVVFDGENQLGLAGTGRLSIERKVHFDGHVQPDDSLPRGIRNGIAMFGRPDTSGRIQIKL